MLINIRQCLLLSFKKEFQHFYCIRGTIFSRGVGNKQVCNSNIKCVCQFCKRFRDVEACTRDPQEVFMKLKGASRGIKLLDVPEIGESVLSQADKIEPISRSGLLSAEQLKKKETRIEYKAFLKLLCL